MRVRGGGVFPQRKLGCCVQDKQKWILDGPKNICISLWERVNSVNSGTSDLFINLFSTLIYYYVPSALLYRLNSVELLVSLTSH